PEALTEDYEPILTIFSPPVIYRLTIRGYW
ncbi:MAG: hypothetical protein QOI94_2361, partial [Acidobacteriaceae bacterium]|nr:hypothetical protein [Acidobacteriaceae bacterium]